MQANAEFPVDFLWGAASASAQIEGGYDAFDRTPSIWDVAPGKKIKNKDSCKSGCEHFYHYKKDVALMKEMGLKTYRFSISWSRVIPEEGKISEKGISFYSDLIDELLNAGIEPIVTIFHWDLPLWVEKKGGWLSEKIIPLFEEYTRVVVTYLGKRVKYFVTINEPQNFIMNSYMTGMHAPFKKKYLALPKMTKNCMFAHAAAVRIIRTLGRKDVKVGAAMAFGVYIPKSESKEDIQWAKDNTISVGAAMVSNRWWMDTMLKGKAVSAYGIYRINDVDAKKMCEPLDFIGLNLYQPLNHQQWAATDEIPVPGRPKNSMDWDIDGRTMYWACRFVYETYQIPILITENGMPDYDVVSLDNKVHDPKRIDFIHRYLSQLKRAISEGIPVLGYQYWAVMDNFEWAEGYDPRFGLIYINYETKERILKDSAYEYKRIIESNGSVIEDDVW